VAVNSLREQRDFAKSVTLLSAAKTTSLNTAKVGNINWRFKKSAKTDSSSIRQLRTSPKTHS
jgi:hypothetical protein